MKSSSLRMIDAGIPDPRSYRDAIIHDWTLSETYARHLGIYKILETTPTDFFHNMKDGEVRVKGKSYSVIWMSSPQVIREAERTVVSFRYCKFMDRGYALVRAVLGQDSFFEKLEY